MLLSQLSLVVPSLDRQKFMLRSMRYWSKKGPKVFFLDGSAVPLSPKILSEFDDRIVYIHSPGELLDRLFNVLPLLDTEYAALCGDDEFYIPSGLSRCIGKLEDNSDYVACCGRVIGFMPLEDQIISYPQYANLAGYHLTSDLGEQRVLQHLGNFTVSQIYAVIRQNAFATVIKTIHARKFPVFAIFEIQMGIILSYIGKSEVIPCLTWLRSDGESPRIRNTEPSLIESNRFDTWWKNPKTKEEREEFISLMAKTMVNIDYCSQEKAQKIVFNACESYYQALQTNKVSLFIKFRRTVRAKISAFIRKILFKLFNISIKRTSLIEMTELLKKEGVDFDINALKEINQILLEFHGFNKTHAKKETI